MEAVASGRRVIRSSPVAKSVHLLFNDISRFPDSPGEEVRLFQDRNADFATSKGAEYLPGLILNVLPLARFTRQDIFETFNSSDNLHNHPDNEID
jgi:hypothetical protein